MRRLLPVGRLSSVVLFIAVAACSGDVAIQGGGTDENGNHSPEVVSWSCDPQSVVVGSMTTCSWQIRDADAERIACAFDVGADGTIDSSLDDCAAASSAPFTMASL